MQLPFTVDQFFDVFRAYNESVWPAQIFLAALAVTALILAFIPRCWSSVVVSLILSFLWMWSAIAYHVLYFSRINPLAWLFAAISIVGSLGIAWHGVVRRALRYAWDGGVRAGAGLLLVLFALVIYPIWSSLGGHCYPAAPTFGLPCPTTIFTIGMMALLVRPHPRMPLIVPVVWSGIGAQAAIFLGIPQDSFLGIAGLAGLALLATAGLRRKTRAA
ncbi:MAG TPA: DUF6064 family protein [Terriglobia bacterium]|nr:DUF6064 family protein [Terriglobia bacterium]